MTTLTLTPEQERVLAAHARKKAAKEARELRRLDAVAKVTGEAGEQTERRAIPTPWRVETVTRQKGLCVACGLPLVGGTFEYDHRIPIALGGAHDADNIDALHARPCHLDKSRRDVKAIAKAKRLAAKHTAPIQPSRHFRRWGPASRGSGA